MKTTGLWLVVLVLSFGSNLGGFVPSALAAANWAQTYYNGGHTGYNPSEKTLGKGNVASLQLLWATSVAGGVTAFAVDGAVVYATGQSNNLVALNATTGAQLWSANTGVNNYFSSPVVATGGGLVFTECSSADANGDPYGAVCGYKASTGKMAWQWGYPCNCLPESRLQSAIVYNAGVVYFSYTSSGGTNGIYAVRATTGKTLWGDAAYNWDYYMTSVAVAGSNVYADASASNPGAIYSITASNGDPVWTTQIANGALSVSGGTIYNSTNWNGTNATVYALNGTTGAILWSYVYGTENWCGSAGYPFPPAIADGVVYFNGVDANLYALHAKTGKLLWADTPNTGQCGFGFLSSPSVANGVVYIEGGDAAGFSAQTTVYDGATGALLWSSPSQPGTLWMPPVVVNGTLYFASPGGDICESICAYALPAGSE